MNIAERVTAITQKINLEKVFGEGGLDINDDVKIITIGATKEDSEATPVEMDGALVGYSVANYTVPAGKKVIPIKLVGYKYNVTTDKDCVLSVRETATSKIEAHILEGQPGVIEEYPFSDHEFVATKVIKLYFVTEAGAAGVFMRAYFIGLEINA